ncbi:MAG: type II toxin-antitoxin system VapC family toxin [Candidatus Hydrogenedentes bacterium]|nr:type II toxin-antitoxin system VapC family toxin [Candidatus Hydrogenedentota bacterium]
MRQVFADTSFYQALLNPADSWHSHAVHFSEQFSETIVTTEQVLTELGALMSRGHWRQVYVDLILELRADPLTRIVPAASEHFSRGFELFTKRPDKYWSITDCISFSIMHQMKIDTALTCDKHFEQAGFQNVLMD